MPETTIQFETLLLALRQKRGIDLTGYKRASLLRRFARRMQALGMADMAEYAEYTDAHPGELRTLLDTILINVTGFFRDAPTREEIGSEIIPRLLAAKDRGEPIRVWSAGCASGQEAYTLAMLLAESLGLDEVRRRVKIYATDLDEDALAQARSALYTERQAASIPPPLLDKYFERQGEHWQCVKDLRRAIIFACHDLLQDAPISRLDLLTCRNTLMYFNPDAQAQALARLHFALHEGGILVLGKAEMLTTHPGLFAPVSLKRRIFVKVPKAGLRERLAVMAQAGPLAAPHGPGRHTIMMQDIAFDSGAVAQVVIDRSGLLSLINEQARALFTLTPQDVGRPLQDLELSYRPAELRSLIDRVYADRRPAGVRNVAWPTRTGASVTLDILVMPLLDTAGDLLGASITFADVTPILQLQGEMQATHRQLETAYEELQSTYEELETTYEELQSTIEELETTNEELQSTNEELETMNEELQATNADLQSINAEAQRRGEAVTEAHALTHAILGSLRSGVVVLDSDLRVQVWNAQAEDLWGLRADEAQGRHFANLDIGLPVDRLTQPIRDCLSGRAAPDALVLPAHNRKGREIVCRVTCTPLQGADGARQGVILLMDEQDKGAALS